MAISSQQPMVAIFIDADNVSSQFASKIMEKLALLGDVVVRRMSKLSKILDELVELL